jgi:chromosome segregation ATPase
MQATQSRSVSNWGYNAPQEEATIEEVVDSSPSRIVQFSGSLSGQSNRATDEISKLSRQLITEKSRSSVLQSRLTATEQLLLEANNEIARLNAQSSRRVEEAVQQANEAADNHYYQAGQDRAEEVSWMDWYRNLSWTALGLGILGVASGVAAVGYQIFQAVK